jgi:hypothetical protein
VSAEFLEVLDTILLFLKTNLRKSRNANEKINTRPEELHKRLQLEYAKRLKEVSALKVENHWL